MPRVRISAEAEQDIDHIAPYSTLTWGWRQSDQYLAKLEDGLTLIANNPSIGRSCRSIRTGLLRFEIGSHVAFYLPESDGILVVRILHQQMLPANYV